MKVRSGLIASALAAVLLCAPIASAVATSATKYLDKPIEWFSTPEAAEIASHILSYQAPGGGFPKNIDTAAAPYTGNPQDLQGTFDNGATTDELRYLARMTAATGDGQYKAAFLKGVDYVLQAQYPNGGWPQTYPSGEETYDHYITFNDGAMARLMFFIKEVARDPLYSFVDPPRRDRCQAAWDLGVQCILKCQVVVKGKLTAWCQQNDEHDFSPRPARTFEPAALTACESVGVIHVLMHVDDPDPRVIAAVDAGVAWLTEVQIKGIRLEDRPKAGTPRGFERYVVQDPTAAPMWARYYEIGTNRPIYCGRDSIIKYDLAEIEIERRTGYQWLKYWPKNLIAAEYPAWKAALAKTSLPAK